MNQRLLLPSILALSTMACNDASAPGRASRPEPQAAAVPAGARAPTPAPVLTTIAGGLVHLRTSAWGRPAELQMRQSGPRLQMRAGAQGAVYEVVFGKTGVQAQQIDAAQWLRAMPEPSGTGEPPQAGGTTDCASQVPATAVQIDTRAQRAQLHGRELRIAGLPVIGAWLSPRGDLIALWSAATEAGSVAPALGAGHTGPFHLQVVKAADGTPMGAPVALPFGPNVRALQWCWSPQQDYLVAVDVVLSELAIVPIYPGGLRP